MKWRNHKLVTFCTVYSVTGSLIPSSAAMVGSVMPDLLEFRGLIKHRTITHYLWFWLAACVFLWMLLHGQETARPSFLPIYITFFLVSGAFLHVCQDALSIGGVPVYTPYGIKAGLGVYRTDTFGEEITALCMALIFTLFSWKRGYLSSGHFEKQMQSILGLLA